MRKQLTKMVMAAVGTMMSLMGMAQTQNCVPTAADYEKFAKTKTVVVLDDNMWSDYNMAIKKDMKNEWTVTNVEYVNMSKFEKMRQDPQYSFLMTTTVTYHEDKIKAKYTYLGLLLGKKTQKLKNMPDLISVPLAYANVDDQSLWTYKLPALIRFMLKHVEAMKANPSLISESPLLMYNKNSISLKNKTLYLVKSELDPELRTENAVKAVYPYKFKFVSTSEVRTAIENKDADVVFLHKVGPGDKSKTRCYKMLMGASDAEVYYFDYHMINARNPDCLRPEDLKKIAKN